MKTKVTKIEKSNQIGSMVVEVQPEQSDFTDDPAKLVKVNFDHLVKWVCERGLLQRCPRNFPLSLPKRKLVFQRVLNPQSKFFGKRIPTAPDVFLLVHGGRAYHERLQPPLTDLERCMLQYLNRTQIGVTQFEINYNNNDLRQATIYAFELSREMLTIYASLKFNDDVTDGINWKKAQAKGTATTKRKFAKQRAARTAKYQPDIDRRVLQDGQSFELALMYTANKHKIPRETLRKYVVNPHRRTSPKKV